MPTPWPTFTTWQRIQEDDRAAISDILAELLAHGALIGEAGRDRELYLLAREYQRELGEYLAPLHLEVLVDPDRPIMQLRPVPGDCSLIARFNKAETLLVLTLWRIYHDARMENLAATTVITANDIWEKLRLYFAGITPPTEAQLREMLGKLRNRRLVRVEWSEDPTRFGESQVEILPTLPRVIPFENAAAWQQHASLYESTGEPPRDAARNEEEP
ncbi:MAG TPA: DUF4194 domain-containing protein [Verrucomicrobiae bacterium]|nr:DUF4194 domain-containing protein [Verrucomicrobiae bacterium]